MFNTKILKLHSVGSIMVRLLNRIDESAPQQYGSFQRKVTLHLKTEIFDNLCRQVSKTIWAYYHVTYVCLSFFKQSKRLNLWNYKNADAPVKKQWDATNRLGGNERDICKKLGEQRFPWLSHTRNTETKSSICSTSPSNPNRLALASASLAWKYAFCRVSLD